MNSRTSKVLLGAAIVVAFLITGAMDYDSETRAEQVYCAETYLYAKTKGNEGTPAYKGTDFCDKYSDSELDEILLSISSN